MKGIRIVKNKRIVVSIPALQFLGEEFDARAITAIAELCELAIEHPNFGKAGFPKIGDFHLADQATDALWATFGNDFVEEFPEDIPPYKLDTARGWLTVALSDSDDEQRAKRKRLPRDAKRKVRLRIHSSPDSRN